MRIEFRPRGLSADLGRRAVYIERKITARFVILKRNIANDQALAGSQPVSFEKQKLIAAQRHQLIVVIGRSTWTAKLYRLTIPFWTRVLRNFISPCVICLHYYTRVWMLNPIHIEANKSPGVPYDCCNKSDCTALLRNSNTATSSAEGNS